MLSEPVVIRIVWRHGDHVVVHHDDAAIEISSGSLGLRRTLPTMKVSSRSGRPGAEANGDGDSHASHG